MPYSFEILWSDIICMETYLVAHANVLEYYHKIQHLIKSLLHMSMVIGNHHSCYWIFLFDYSSINNSVVKFMTWTLTSANLIDLHSLLTCDMSPLTCYISCVIVQNPCKNLLHYGPTLEIQHTKMYLPSLSWYTHKYHMVSYPYQLYG